MAGNEGSAIPEPEKSPGESVVAHAGVAQGSAFAFSAAAVISQAAGTAIMAAEIAADPRVPEDLRPVLLQIAADSRRTADSVHELVEQGRDWRPLAIGTAIGAAGLALAVWSLLRPT